MRAMGDKEGESVSVGPLMACAVVALMLLMGCLGCQGETVAPFDEGLTSVSEGPGAASEVWRGAVEYRENTVYGSANGYEPMLDLALSDDGSCAVTPLEGHADLVSDTGTWEDRGEVVVLRLSTGLVELRVVDGARLEGDASLFGIEGFDLIYFDLLA